MKTKFGEIKQIEDLFESEKVIDKNGEYTGLNVKCKICGDNVAINLIWFGAYNEMEKHIELHKINGLNESK